MQPVLISRLAPSPTGTLHLGHARTFLLTAWHVAACGGRLVLRHEDIDSTRSRAEVPAAIEEELRWLGIHWDGAPLMQSSRQAIHQQAFESLRAKGLIYPCVCKHKDLLALAAAPHADEEIVYRGSCRGRFASAAEAAAASPQGFAWRFAVPEPVTVAPTELVATTWCPRADAGGDFLIGRTAADGLFNVGYQLAVVVDDAAAGVNLVVRGRDLLPSTPRQVLLQRALGLATPQFAHLGLVVDASGRRLAKRTNASHLSEMRKAGVSAAEVRAWVAQSARLLPSAAASDVPGLMLGPSLSGDVEVPRAWCAP
jgi:glutamyl-tRNA synthetase